MKKKLIAVLAAALMAAGTSATAVYADDAVTTGDVPIGSSNEVQMVGLVEPTIMSVTMPSYVPFHISRATEGENKVISPRITVTNNSSIPVELNVSYTKVDLSNLPGTSWNGSRYIGTNQIAIGFKREVINNKVPTTLDDVKWLQANAYQNLDIMSLNAYGNSSMYVVGTLGDYVPENKSFSVTPTFVVKQAR